MSEPTKRLLIEETLPGATGSGIREIFDPTPEMMAELGWVRAPNLDEQYCETHGATTWGVPCPFCRDGDPAAVIAHDPRAVTPGTVQHEVNGAVIPEPIPDLVSPAPADPATNGKVVSPCPVHDKAGYNYCEDCRAWNERDSEPPPAEPQRGKLPSEEVATRALERARAALDAGYGLGEPNCDQRVAALLEVLDERLGRQ